MMSNRSEPQRARHLVALLAGVVIAAAVLVTPQVAQAYNLNGCRWNSSSVQLDIRYTNGNFRTALLNAIGNYNGSTDVALSPVYSSGPSFRAENGSYGATGWEGQNSYVCLYWFSSSTARVNMYYLSGTEPIDRLKMVWLHELGHGLGLDHVSVNTRVMWTSASDAYFNGTTSLTFDEIAGINSLY